MAIEPVDLEKPAVDPKRLSSKKWLDEIKLARKYFKKWEEKGEAIIKRYRDEEKGDGVRVSRFNIFWASLEVMKPAILGRAPKTECERRFKDADPVGRLASNILERATDYSIEAHQDFIDVARAVRDDFLLVGRGVLWERYKPYINQGESRVDLQIGDTPGSYKLKDGEPLDEDLPIEEDEHGPFYKQMVEELAYEESITDYVFWKDFLHSPARNWNEVRWVARRAFMTEDEIESRFGEGFHNVPMAHCPEEIQEDTSITTQDKQKFMKSAVWEVWDKVSRTVYWVVEGYDILLDAQPDPLKLKDFFPCARPLFSTLTTDSLIPRPFFSMAQHQANEIDILTERITVLTDALRCSGVCAPDTPELLRVFKVDNTLIPIQNWTTFAAKGGFDGVLQFVPIEQVVNVLKQLYESREIALQKFYEVTGWSDISRGTTDPRETATAQGLKSQYTSKRLQEKVDDMARFLRDQIAIKAEIIAEHFQPETLALMTGADKSGSIEEFMAAIQLLKQDTMRCFRVSIETDSTTAMDENLEKQRRSEFLESVGKFISEGLPVVKENPEFLPFYGEALMFLARGFKAGRQLESVLEQGVAAITQKAQQQAQAEPAPDPEQQKLQMQAQVEQARGQSEAQKAQLEMQKAQLEMQKAAHEAQLKERELQLKTEIAASDAQIKQTDLALKDKEIEVKAALEKHKADVKASTDLQMHSQKMRSEALIRSAMAGGAPAVDTATDEEISPEEKKPKRKVARFMTDPESGDRMAVIEEID